VYSLSQQLEVERMEKRILLQKINELENCANLNFKRTESNTLSTKESKSPLQNESELNEMRALGSIDSRMIKPE
jgi:hypothetical protein